MMMNPNESNGSAVSPGSEEERIFVLVQQLLHNPSARESALLELSKRRETFEDLALVLWHAFGMGIDHPLERPSSLTGFRCHGRALTRDYWNLRLPQPAHAHHAAV
jgi:hypothetical protein